MATYAIGDVQGCYDELRELLDRMGFEPARDRRTDPRASPSDDRRLQRPDARTSSADQRLPSA